MTGEERGWNPKADELACRLGVRDRVLMLPPLDYASLLTYTANADAGVLLYDNNDLGNYFTSPGRLTEYLACGLPVLASRFAGLESLVYRYGIGECVDASDPKSIAIGITKLEAGIASGQFEHDNLRQCFERHFAFERWAPQIVEAFEGLLSRKSKKKQAPPPQYVFPGPVQG
jgi:glycosyltransferase involved in cell wall biosynthesis